MFKSAKHAETSRVFSLPKLHSIFKSAEVCNSSPNLYAKPPKKCHRMFSYLVGIGSKLKATCSHLNYNEFSVWTVLDCESIVTY